MMVSHRVRYTLPDYAKNPAAFIGGDDVDAMGSKSAYSKALWRASACCAGRSAAGGAR